MMPTEKPADHTTSEIIREALHRLLNVARTHKTLLEIACEGVSGL